MNPLQTTPAVVREGLPYWLFYFLVSLVVLLLLVIFLRDKDLRRRLSHSLHGAKQRVLRKRLQLRLEREKRRKIFLFRELGRTIWGGRIAGESFGPAFARLERLEADIASRHASLQTVNDGILAAESELEETRKRRRAYRINTENGPKLEGRAGRETERAIKRRIKELARSSKAERAALRLAGRNKADEYEHLGVQADGLRIAHIDLRELYDRIDRINCEILIVLDKIEKLH